MRKGYKITLKTLIFILSLNSTSNLIAYAYDEESIINKSKTQYEALSSETLEFKDKIVALNMEIESLNLKLEENNSKIESITTEIDVTKGLIKENQADLEEKQDRLSQRIRSLSKNDFASNILVAFINSESVIDLFHRISSVSKIISIDKTMMKDIENERVSLKERVAKLNEDEAVLKALNDSIEADIENVNSKVEEQQELLDSLYAQMNDIIYVIETNESKLVENSINIIYNEESDISDIKNAVTSLDSLITHLYSEAIISRAEEAISYGKYLIELDYETNKSPVVTPSTKPGSNGDNNAAEGGIATYTMESTAYYGHTITATGSKPVRDPNGISTVAVDPSVIPLGSKVYVENYGVAIAADTGGAIKGNKVDVFLNTYEECISWGRRNVTVTLLALPGEW